HAGRPWVNVLEPFCSTVCDWSGCSRRSRQRSRPERPRTSRPDLFDGFETGRANSALVENAHAPRLPTTLPNDVDREGDAPSARSGAFSLQSCHPPLISEMPQIIGSALSRFIAEPFLEELLGQILRAQPDRDRRSHDDAAEHDSKPHHHAVLRDTELLQRPGHCDELNAPS